MEHFEHFDDAHFVLMLETVVSFDERQRSCWLQRVKDVAHHFGEIAIKRIYSRDFCWFEYNHAGVKALLYLYGEKLMCKVIDCGSTTIEVTLLVRKISHHT
jgi:hypothetical protein